MRAAAALKIKTRMSLNEDTLNLFAFKFGSQLQDCKSRVSSAFPFPGRF